MTLQLQSSSCQAWLAAVLSNFDSFLLDHAANEKKAASVALNLSAHYPDKPELVLAMIDLAIEELNHYREVFKLVQAQGLTLPPDEKDVYVNRLRSHIRSNRTDYFLDRLLVAAIIEARGLERFGKIAEALPVGTRKSFYEAISQSEARHAHLFLSLAEQYCDPTSIAPRLTELLQHEAQILTSLPIRAALH